MKKDKLGIIYTVSLNPEVDKVYPPFPHQIQEDKTGLIHLKSGLLTIGVNSVFTAVSRSNPKTANFGKIRFRK